MLNLRQFRSKATSYSDLLNFALLPDNGIHQGKDGSLLAAWYYRGQDMGHCTQLELAATAAQLNRALTRLGSGWMLHVDAIRRYSVGYPTAEACSFPDRTSLVVDAERRVLYDAQGKHLESIYALSLTYLPPGKIENKIVSMLYEDVETEGADNGTAARILATFKRQIAEVEETFASVLPMRRMLAQAVDKDADGRVIYHDELLRYFELTCSGEDRPVRLPPIPMYLDAIIGCHSFVGGVQPKVGSRFVKVVAIDGYPQESLPGILSALDALDFPYRWNTRFIFLDPHQAKAVLERHRKKWQQKQRGLKDQVLQTSRGAVNIDAVRMTSDAEEAMGEADSGLVKYGFLTTTIVITDEDLTIAGERAEAVRKLISDIGFSARIEDVNAVEAFLGSIPSHGFPNVRRAVVHTLNLADMLPITAVWAGPERHPCDFYPPNSPPLAYGHTTGSTPMRLALHVGDVGHTLIAGFTGGGKSTLMRFFEIQHLRYKDAQVFSFDKGYSGYVQCNAVGGSYYDIGGPDAKLTFCPLKDVDQAEDRAWAAEWIETLLALQQVTVTPHQRNLIFQALERLGLATSRTMTEFVSELQDESLRAALQHYTLSGASGDLFDSATDSLGTNNYQVFEMEHVMGSGEKNVIPLLLYLFRQIEKRLDGRPTLVTLDEVWLMLSHPMFAEKIREWLKTLRKKNAAVVMATQELSDFFNSPIRDTILSNCLTKILLPNKEAKSPTARPGYEAIGLNERELDILSTATPKRHYYYRSPLGRRLFGLGLGPVALSFVAVSDPAEIKIARGMIKEHGQEWPARWLERRGLNDWALYWRQVTQ